VIARGSSGGGVRGVLGIGLGVAIALIVVVAVVGVVVGADDSETTSIAWHDGGG
jgi:hypothetical protein